MRMLKFPLILLPKLILNLSEASLELGEDVIVVATRPMVTKDLTASTAIVGADDFAKLPVTEFAEVLSLKAGIVGNNGGFNVRGGRGGEVSYLIDGVPVTDSYDGSTVVDVAASSIQELQFVSGAFNAEYGKALIRYYQSYPQKKVITNLMLLLQVIWEIITVIKPISLLI